MANPVPESPLEMARSIKKMLQTASIEEIAKQTRKQKAWIENTVSLLKLHHLIQCKVDDGHICLGNAYILAKLPLLLQLALRERAEMTAIAEFTAYVETLP